jgi:hypothetical protein
LIKEKEGKSGRRMRFLVSKKCEGILAIARIVIEKTRYFHVKNYRVKNLELLYKDLST